MHLYLQFYLEDESLWQVKDVETGVKITYHNINA